MLLRLLCISLFSLVIATGPTLAQKQLVLLKKEKVMLRLHTGDEVTLSLKGDEKRKIRSYINNLYDTAVMLHDTVVPFYKIDRIYFRRSNFRHVVGGLLVTGGVGYFLIDQINVVLVDGDKANLDKRVTIPSLVMVGVGLPMLLLKKDHQKIGGRYRLRSVDKNSGFYQPDLRRDMMDGYRQ